MVNETLIGFIVIVAGVVSAVIISSIARSRKISKTKEGAFYGLIGLVSLIAVSWLVSSNVFFAVGIAGFVFAVALLYIM